MSAGSRPRDGRGSGGCPQHLWSFTRNHPPTLEQLHAIATHLIGQFAAHLWQEVVCFHEHLVDGEALAYSIRPASPLGRALAVQWEAVILYDVRQAGRPAIDVELFLFSLGQRVRPAAGDYINFVGKPGDSDRSVEFEASWRSDEFREWEYLTAPQTELYGEVRRTYG